MNTTSSVISNENQRFGFWGNLPLGRKLLLAFGALFVFGLIIAASGLLGLNRVQSSYEDTLAGGVAVQNQSDKLSISLLEARRREKDFLLRWKTEGFDVAYESYVKVNQEHTAEMKATLQELGSLAPVLDRASIADYSRAKYEADIATLNQDVLTYEQSFASAVSLLEQRGFVDTGLEGGFRVSVQAIEAKIYDREGLDKLVITMLQIRRREKDYLLRGDQQYVDNVHELVAQLKTEVTASELLEPAEKTEIRALADDYEVKFDGLVAKDVEAAAEIEVFRAVAADIQTTTTRLETAGEQLAAQDVATAQSNSTQTFTITGIIVLVVLIVSIILSLVLSRQITSPVSVLTDAAHELESGNYDAQASVTSGDEVGTLATAFNGMARQIKQALAAIAQRAVELQTVAEVSASASTLLDTEKLLWNVSNLTKEKFGLYHAHIYMLNEAGDTLHLAAGAGEAGQQMVTKGFSIPLDREQSLVARAARERKGVIVNDVRSAPDFLPNPLLPETRSELAVPMIVGDKVIGVFDVQSDVKDRFTQENADIQTTMATQIAVALQNANLFAQAETSAQEAQSLVDNAPEGIVIIDLATGLFTDPNENAVKIYGLQREELVKVGPAHMSPPTQPDGRNSTEKAMEKIGEAVQGSTPVFEWIHRNGQGQDIPCEIRLVRMPGDRPRVRASVTDITQRKRDEELTIQRAKQLETVAAISTASSTVLEPEKLLQTVTNLTKERFNLYHAHIYLMNESMTSLVLASGAGEIGMKMVSEGYSIPADKERSLVARAARERQAVIVNNVRSEPDFLANPLLPETRAEMAVPLIVGDRVLGVVDVQSDQIDHFTQEDVSIQTALAAQIAIALQNARTLTQAQRQAERETMLNTIGQKIQSATTVEAVLQIAARELGRALDAPLTIAQLGMGMKDRGGNGNNNGNGHGNGNGNDNGNNH